MHCTNTPIRHFVSMNSIVWFGCETDLHFSSAIYLNSFLASDHIDAMTLGAIPFLRHCGNRQWDGNFVKATTRATSHTKSMNPSIMMNNFQRITFPSSVRFIQCDDAFVANSHASFEWHSNKKKNRTGNTKKWKRNEMPKVRWKFVIDLPVLCSRSPDWRSALDGVAVFPLPLFAIPSHFLHLVSRVRLPPSPSRCRFYRCCILTIFQMIYLNAVNTDNRKSVCCEHHQSTHARLRLEASLRSPCSGYTS